MHWHFNRNNNINLFHRGGLDSLQSASISITSFLYRRRWGEKEEDAIQVFLDGQVRTLIELVNEMEEEEADYYYDVTDRLGM